MLLVPVSLRAYLCVEQDRARSQGFPGRHVLEGEEEHLREGEDPLHCRQ